MTDLIVVTEIGQNVDNILYKYWLGLAEYRRLILFENILIDSQSFFWITEKGRKIEFCDSVIKYVFVGRIMHWKITKKIAVSKSALQYPITTSNSSVRFYPTRTTNNVARISESFL